MIKIIALALGKRITSYAGYHKTGRAINFFCQSKEDIRFQKTPLAQGSPLQTQPASSSELNLKTNASLPSSRRAPHPYESIPNQGRRIEFQIFSCQLQPSFIREYIESSPTAKSIKEFNPHLTNGGDSFDEFPLVKLLSIALLHIQENTINSTSWKQLQFFIKKRLHRCTIEQNMKLLYIMLKSFPKYSFDYGFILSICLALKKEINLMSNQQLKMLFYVLFTNRNGEKKYSNPILASLQSLILTKVLQKWEKRLTLQQKEKHTHLPIEHLYNWITLGLTLSVRNNYSELIFEERAIDLIRHFNLRWEAAVLKEQQNRIVHAGEITAILYLVCIYEKLFRFCGGERQQGKSEKGKIDFKDEFGKFKMNLVAHTSKKIGKLIQESPPLQSIRTLRVVAELYSFNLVQNLLEVSEEVEKSLPLDAKYPKTLHVFTNVMKYSDASREILTEKVKLLNNLYNKGLLSFDAFKSYYLSLCTTFNSISSTLELVHELITLELYIFESQAVFSPQESTVQFILGFLQNHPHTYRHFDWQTFHFLSQLLSKQQISSNPLLSDNLPVQKQQPHTTLASQISQALKKLVEQVKFYNTSRLVDQQIEILRQNLEIKKIEKFFIEIRVNEMEQFQPILPPFNRLPHFSNLKEKIAVNSLTSEEMGMASFRLEKKLMNASGWRVINLNSEMFAELSLNERLRVMTAQLEEEAKFVESAKQSGLTLADS